MHEQVEITLNCSFEVSGGSLRAIAGKPSSLIGVPFDRPVVGYGGKTINTLRLWAPNASDYFDFQVFSHGDFVGAVAETLEAESLTRVLYPDDSTSMGQGLGFVQEYFLVACSLADLIPHFRRSNGDWSALPEKVAIQLNDTHPTMAVPELINPIVAYLLGRSSNTEASMHRSFGEQHNVFGDHDGPLVGAGQQLPATLETLALVEGAQCQDGLTPGMAPPHP